MKKPTPKREVVVQLFSRLTHMIRFYATLDAVTEFEQFGHLEPDEKHNGMYRLFVDPRYDFDEVLEYMKNYG